MLGTARIAARTRASFTPRAAIWLATIRSRSAARSAGAAYPGTDPPQTVARISKRIHLIALPYRNTRTGS